MNENAKGKELAALKRELHQAHRLISRQAKRIQQLESQIGSGIVEEPAEAQEPEIENKCIHCQSINTIDIALHSSTVRVCKDCKERWKLAA